MVEADFSGNYVVAENAPDKSIMTITGKPVIEEKEGEYGKYNVTNIPVEIDGKEKIYSPSRESGNKMIVTWGKEMDDWVGKQATVRHVLKQVKGETKTYIEVYPIKDVD